MGISSPVFFILVGFFGICLYLISDHPLFERTPVFRTVGIIFVILMWSAGFYLNSIPYTPPVIHMLHTATLFTAATLIGTYLASAIRRASEIIVLCVVASMADLFSILLGPTRQFAQELTTFYETGMPGKAPLVDLFIIKVAIPGQTLIQPLFGVSDWIIIVLLATCTLKFKFSDNLFQTSLTDMNLKKRPGLYLPVPGLGLLCSLLTAAFLDRMIPALPLISIATILYLLIYVPESRKLKPSEWWIMILFPTLIGLAMFIYH